MSPSHFASETWKLKDTEHLHHTLFVTLIHQGAAAGILLPELLKQDPNRAVTLKSFVVTINSILSSNF